MDWLNIVGWLVGTVILVLGPIILIHELGHFISAKLVGVRVEEFGLGYPPRLLRLWRGRGHLVVEETRVEIPRRYQAPPRADIGSWVDVDAVRRDDGTYALHHLTLLNPVEDELTARRELVERDLHIRGELSDFEPGTVYSLNLLPMGAFVRMMGEEDPTHPRSLAAQPKRHRVAVMASGAALNVVFALVLLVIAYSAGIPGKWRVQVNSVEPGTAASEARLMPGDVIVAVDGVPIDGGDEQFRSIILDSPGLELRLALRRDGQTVLLTARPRRGADGKGYLGVYMERRPDTESMERFSLPEALQASTRDIAALVTVPFQIPRMLASGEVTPQEVRPNSMIGIGSFLTLFLQQSLAWRWAFPIVHTAGLISLSLGITNLLPLPALDGGRIMFVLVEAVRRRRIPPEREAVVHVVGLLILIGLMAIVMIQDLVNPVIPWDWLQR